MYSIFCGDHFGCLSQCLVLAEQDQEIVFMVSSNDAEQIDCLKKMERVGLFHLIIYDYKCLSKEGHWRSLKKSIVEYFYGILSSAGYDIYAATEIYVSNSSAYCLFEMFLALIGTKYTLVEFSKNEFQSKKIVNSISQYDEISNAYRELFTSLGVGIGNNRLCARHIYSYGSKIDSSLPGKISFLNIAAELSNLSAERKRKILSVYYETIDKMPCNLPTLLIPNSESLTRRALRDCKEYIRNLIAPYVLLSDLLGVTSERLIIKPHPYGDFSFEEYFPNAIIVDKNFPIEFLNLIPNCSIERLVSIETSAADKVKALVHKNVVASRYFMLNLNYMLALYYSMILSGILYNRRVFLYSPDADKFEQIVHALSDQVKFFRENHLKLTSDYLQICETDIVLSFQKEHLLKIRNHLCEFSITRKSIKTPSVYSNGEDKIFMVGELSNEEICQCNKKFYLPCSGLEVSCSYGGLCNDKSSDCRKVWL